MSHLRDKSDIKLIQKDGNPNKPAFSTRNVLNLFTNNDLIKKIECLKNNNKIIVSNNNKGSNVIDLSESRNKLRINVLGNVNNNAKENTHSHDNNVLKSKASGKSNVYGNVININNNVTNNINIGEAAKN